MITESPGHDRDPQNIDPVLHETAQDIKNGNPPFRIESLQEELGWKHLALARHKASKALVKAPFLGVERSDVRDWLESDPGSNPLLSGEIEPIIESGLILPNPQESANLNVVSNFNPTKQNWIGIYMEDPETLAWYEPSVNFLATRFHTFLRNNPDKTAGLTTGKWRIPHAAHLDILWEMRQQCDFMAVAVDPKDHDEYRVQDGFVPEFEEKVALLRAIDFPDGRKIDLLFETHFQDPEEWFSDLYLVYALSESLMNRQSKKEDLEAYMRLFPNAHEYHLKESRKYLDPYETERRSRLYYFLSEKDPFFEHKRLLASRRGYEVKELTFQGWKTEVSASKLVRKFDLGKYTQT